MKYFINSLKMFLSISDIMRVQYSYMTHFGGSKEGNGSTENEGTFRELHILAVNFIFRMQNGIKIYSGMLFPTYVDKYFLHWPEWNHSSTRWKHSWVYPTLCQCSLCLNGSFWNDSNRVLDELKMKGNCSDYINSYMSYIEMQRATFRLVIKGEFLCSYI